jgi:hypothetical protein
MDAHEFHAGTNSKGLNPIGKDCTQLTQDIEAETETTHVWEI